MTREKSEKLREATVRYQSVKAKMNCMLVILGITIVLMNQLYRIDAAPVRYCFYLGIAVHTIMFIRLYYRLRNEKILCMTEISELSSGK